MRRLASGTRPGSRPGSWSRQLAGDSAWMLGAQIVRTAGQAAYFILVARALGAHEFGILVATLAITAIAVPFAGWGGSNLMIMQTTRNRPSFALAFGTSLLMICVAGLGLVVLTSTASVLLVTAIPVKLAVQIALADLIFARIAETCSQAYQGFGRLAMSARLGTVPSLLRLAAAGGFAWSGGASALAWSGWYLGASALAATIALIHVLTRLGRPILSARAAARQWRQGFLFAVGASSASIYNDLDKTMVAALSTVRAAGVYGAASRVVATAFTPILSVFTATYYRFFAAGAQGIDGTIALARSLAASLLGLGVAAAAVLWVAAPLVPRVLGSDFASAEAAIRWLALVPLLQTIFYLAGDVLTGAGYQGLRSGIQLGAAGLNIGLNLYLIPAYSWRGAAVATLATDAVLGLAPRTAVVRRARRPRCVPSPVPA
jgi:O-antigen/teichoic acid export membrane protein